MQADLEPGGLTGTAMSLYLPGPFAETTVETLHALIGEHGFGMLVTVHDGSPAVSHLPFLLAPTQGANGTLFAHMARANPQWRDFADGQPALAIFAGPHAYVSPRWYRPGKAVPTWNYAVVHAHGSPRIVTDTAEVRRQQDALVATYEGAADGAWSLDGQPADYVDAMLRGIVAFEMPIDRLEGKFKLSQNRDAADRAGVIDGLRATGRADDTALADLMAAREDGQSD